MAGRADRPARGGDHALGTTTTTAAAAAAAVQSQQAVGREVGQPRPVQLERRADAFQRARHRLPRPLDRERVGRHQAQLGAARERLAERHPGPHPERLRRARHLPHASLAPRQRGDRQRAPGQPLLSDLRAAPGGDREL